MIPARYAPVISAIPNTSARNASAKQNASDKHRNSSSMTFNLWILISRKPLKELLDPNSTDNRNRKECCHLGQDLKDCLNMESRCSPKACHN